LPHVVWLKFTDVPEVLAPSIIRGKEKAVNTFETTLKFYKTIQHNIRKDIHLQI
jgi:hypothetical protein